MLLVICQIVFLYGQSIFTFNQGFADNKNYLINLPYTQTAGKIMIDVVINNQTRKFILDTGAGTVISDKLFKELHPKILKNINVSDASGVEDSLQVVAVPGIKISSVTFRDTPAVVLKDSKIFLDCFGADGLIGSNLLRNSAVQFNDKTKTITLTDQPELLNPGKREGINMEVSATQSDPYIRINLKNGKAVAYEKILIDTGDDVFYQLSLDAYKHLSKDITLFKSVYKSRGSYSAGINGTAANAENYRVTIPVMEVNGMRFKDVPAKTTYSEISRLGSEILRYGTITLDYINKKFYAAPYQEVQEIDMQKKQWPIDPVMNDGKLAVGIIWDQKLTKEINTGDQIIRFNGIDYQKMNTCEIITSKKDNDRESALLELKDVKTGNTKQVELHKL